MVLVNCSLIGGFHISVCSCHALHGKFWLPSAMSTAKLLTSLARSFGAILAHPCTCLYIHALVVQELD
uniref:Uncharacterized protein n=1 Tax=Arundo donax TaxID=35708 RepID=A0A0A9FUP7_ARUDO